jgi:hypothetical protein
VSVLLWRLVQYTLDSLSPVRPDLIASYTSRNLTRFRHRQHLNCQRHQPVGQCGTARSATSRRDMQWHQVTKDETVDVMHQRKHTASRVLNKKLHACRLPLVWSDGQARNTCTLHT